MLALDLNIGMALSVLNVVQDRIGMDLAVLVVIKDSSGIPPLVYVNAHQDSNGMAKVVSLLVLRE